MVIAVANTRTDNGQTFPSLELAVSSVDAWNAQTDESRQWIASEILPCLGWSRRDFYSDEGHREFRSWIFYFDNLLNALGYIGHFYEPQLYFKDGRPILRWPSELGLTVGRAYVEKNPGFFAENVGLVLAKPRGVSEEDIFVAAIVDSDEIDRPPISNIVVALDALGRAYTLGPEETLPPELLRQYPEHDLIVRPWRVRFSQAELARGPFNCAASQFREGTPTSPAVATINFVRDRAAAIGLEIPTWARSYCGKELAARIDPTKPNLGQQLEESSPGNEQLLESFLGEISKAGGLSPQQWRLLLDTSDISCATEYVQVIQSLEEMPEVTGDFWSQVYHDVLALIRYKKRGRARGDFVVLSCEHPGCWCRFVLTDRRTRHCPRHRQSLTEHRRSTARQARREKERLRSGIRVQRDKWAAQKRQSRCGASRKMRTSTTLPT